MLWATQGQRKEPYFQFIGQRFKKLKKERIKTWIQYFIFHRITKTWKLTSFSCMIKDIQKWAWK